MTTENEGETSASTQRQRSGPTIQDVAEHAGVSTATVSRCLNQPDRVTTTTRQRVLETVDILGYAPNFSARTLAANKSGTIGAVIPTIENAIFARGVQAFQEELGQHGFTLLIASSNYRQELETEQIRNLIARGADALMLIGHDRAPEAYRFLERRSLPFVNAWTFNAGLPAASVGFDNRKAMKDLALEVLTRGHRNIGVISAERIHNDRARERVEGIADALAEYDLEPGAMTVIDVSYSIENGARSFKTLMEMPDPPSAVICGNDVLAVGALDMAKRMAMDVPGDVSITGFDDIELAQISTPRLTTVHVPHREMGRQAAIMLVDMLAGKAEPARVQLQTRLELRETLGKPKNGR